MLKITREIKDGKVSLLSVHDDSSLTITLDMNKKQLSLYCQSIQLVKLLAIIECDDIYADELVNATTPNNYDRKMMVNAEGHFTSLFYPRVMNCSEKAYNLYVQLKKILMHYLDYIPRIDFSDIIANLTPKLKSGCSELFNFAMGELVIYRSESCLLDSACHQSEYCLRIYLAKLPYLSIVVPNLSGSFLMFKNHLLCECHLEKYIDLYQLKGNNYKLVIYLNRINRFIETKIGEYQPASVKSAR